ncbi:MAG: transcription antitermination factor NusB [Chloroflexota bacterium]
MSGPRRKARVLVLKALYEVDLTGHSMEAVLDRLLAEETLPAEAAQYAREVAQSVLGHRERIDGIIARCAPAFPLGQTSAVDRNIMRLAICEALIDNRTPAKVAINEAVELAKAFGAESSPRFVNGVLGCACFPDRAGA